MDETIDRDAPPTLEFARELARRVSHRPDGTSQVLRVLEVSLTVTEEALRLANERIASKDIEIDRMIDEHAQFALEVGKTLGQANKFLKERLAATESAPDAVFSEVTARCTKCGHSGKVFVTEQSVREELRHSFDKNLGKIFVKVFWKVLLLAFLLGALGTLVTSLAWRLL